MTKHPFILQPYAGKGSRHRCPGCGKPGQFTLYIDTQTMEPLHEDVGRCNREVNCGYHFTPKQYFRASGVGCPVSGFGIQVSGARHRKPETRHPTPDTHTQQHVWDTIGNFANNHFDDWLDRTLGIEATTALGVRYLYGTSGHWPGATVFWQIDAQHRARAGKIILYDKETGKRVKQPFNHVAWMHHALKLEGFSLSQCFFGEHLLQEHPTLPVAIVESEKTALIASHFLPQYVWLATGGLGNLTADRCEALRGRKVMLYPDLGAYEKWHEKARELSDVVAFTVSDLLERKAGEGEREKGWDIADYLLSGVGCGV